MERKVVQTDKAPQPIGPYSQAIQAGNFLYTSGQIAIDPRTGELVTSSFGDQARLVLENVQGVLEAAESSLSQVVKVTIFLKDLSKFDEFNKVYAGFFQEAKPARSCVEVSRLPKDVDVEVEVVAMVG